MRKTEQPGFRLVLRLSLLLVTAGLAVLLGSCSVAPSFPTPTPTRTPRVVKPFATTAVPSTTPIPGPTNTPEPTFTPTPDRSVIVPGQDPEISPFTGLRPGDPSVLARRPLAIKIANQASAHPQTGLSKADIVVESQVEFSETRYTAIYQSQDAPRVGSIRSARLIDLELPAIFDAIMCFSGAVEPVRQKLYASDFADRVLEYARNGASYYRDPSIPVPDNLFADTATLWNTATQRGWNSPPTPAAGWVFSEVLPPDSGASASAVDIPYPRFRVRWTYEASSGRWLRSMGGTPHIERADGQQLSAATVIVLTATHVKTLILEHGTSRMGADCSNCSIEIQLWGEGPVKILRDGKVLEGKWVRTERHAPFRFVDAEGKDIPLKPGNSWWQVVAPELAVTVEP